MSTSWRDSPEYSGGGGPQMAMPTLTPVAKVLILANAIVFGAMFLVSIPAPNLAHGFLRLFAIDPPTWSAWFPFVPVWQIFTWGFLHDIDSPMHIVLNMMFLYFLGTMLEGIVGPRRFLATYVSAVLVSGIAVVTVGVVLQQQLPTLGASGAVLALVVAMAVLRPNVRVIFILFPITLRTLAILFVAVDVFYMLAQLKGASSNVAHLAHLTGAAWGYALVKKGWIWHDPFARVEAKLGEAQQRREVADEERLDELLAKIKREGIHTLTPREQAFLKRVSKRR